MRATVNDNLKAGETSTIHRFEAAGLGKAPFCFTGMGESAGSSCDYCGTGIRYQFWVRSADGKVFKVGCDCIHKTDDAGLLQQISVAERELRDKKNQAAKARKVQRLAERVEKAKAKLDSVRGILAAQPHPNVYFAEQGKTLLDYVNWCLEYRWGEKAAAIVEKFSGK